MASRLCLVYLVLCTCTKTYCYFWFIPKFKTSSCYFTFICVVVLTWISYAFQTCKGAENDFQ